MDSAKKQASLFSFFQKTPKSNIGPNGDKPKSESNKQTPMKKESDSSWEGQVERKVQGQKEYHVQFLGEESRSWISGDCVKKWKEREAKGSEGEKDEAWIKGVEEAEKVKTLSNQERLDLLLVPLLPSDEEWSDQEVSPGSKENKPKSPKNKKRKVMVLDSDDSDGDEDFKPSKEDLKLAREEADEDGSGVSSEEPSSEEEPESSPVKGTKRKMTKKQPTSKAKKPKPSPEAASSLSGSVGKFASGLAATPTTPTTSRPLPGIADSTKKKLSMFGAPTAASATTEEEGTIVYNHQKLAWLKPENIKDKDGRKKTDPEYDPRTLYVPPDFLNKQTPALKQWWKLKSQYFDVILFFKMGKFYELFNMDADVGVAELNLIYMKGDQAHAGFPEAAYSKWATTLVEKGYKVARIEQTETPAQLEERNKMRSGPKDKVVLREVCQLTTKGTRVNTFLDSHNFEGDPSYLLALCERPGPVFGVAFVDTTLGCFHLGQFEDDANLSRLRTLLAHYPPGELLQPRGGLSQDTYNCLAATGARRELLRPGEEFWDASKTLLFLKKAEYFKSEDGKFHWPENIASLLEPSDTLGLTASKMGDMAVSSLGAITFYLSSAFLDQQLLSQRRFETYQPLDVGLPVAEEKPEQRVQGLRGKHMVLDGATVANLELLKNSTGGQEAALINLFSPVTAMGKRLLTQWILSPLLQPKAIKARQGAVKDLMDSEHLGQMRALLKKFPDLERLLSKVHASGDKVKSENHPDSRANFFEADRYSKRKIWDMLTLLDGFKQCKDLVSLMKSLPTESKLLQEVAKMEVNGGHFPNLEPITDFFDASFDHEKAKKDGKISPQKGDMDELDDLKGRMKELEREMSTYLKEQREFFGCEVKYWGTGKARFQLEIPVSKVKKATGAYELSSGTKTAKRYTTSETREFLERQQSAEVEEERLVAEHQRKIFAKFSEYAAEWQRAIACISLLDCLGSLAAYSKSLEEGCFPTILEDFAHPQVNIEEGRHPCLDLPGSNYIANDTRIGGIDNSSLIILTGPNMGGKSTLMRQTGLLVVLAQVGCLVPARTMHLTPVDRVFTRLGARDDIVGGQSTFYVELQETSSILTHASRHSLVLIDELGRGTATYDGTAIAGSVVSWLAKKGSLTLFATHYHCLASEAKPGVASAHMSCMVENEGAEDITEENITFLYKLVDGAAPKSHGFNAAKLAGLPASIIRTGYARAREFEKAEKMRELFKSLFLPGAEEDLDNLGRKIKAL